MCFNISRIRCIFSRKSLKKLDLSLCCASPGDLRIVSYFDNIQFLNIGNDEVDESSNSKLRNRLYDLLLSSILNQDTLTNLVSLSVSNASLSTLSEDIGLLSSLKILDVSGNHLNWLPNNLSKLFNLETLNASHNHLKTFPPDFSNLSNLRSLLVSENRLDSVPVDFDKLVLLEYADFYSNLIEEFPREAIESLVKHRLLGLDFAWNFCDPPDESLYVRLRESYRSWLLHRYVSSVEKMKRSSYRRVSIKELPAIENWAVIHDTEGSYLFSDDENSSEDDGNVNPSDGECCKNLTSPNVKYDQNSGPTEVEEGENLRLAESKLDPNGDEEGNWDDEDLFSERFDPSRLDLPLRSTTILSIYEAKGPTPPVQYYIRDDLGPFRYPYHHMAFCPSDIHPSSVRYGMRSLPQNCSFTIDDEQFEDV
ncbi:uncharacterized protein [Bemisia tabaci]|uniref:uncharacterized protein n=1 Tax=Bemisia tabaci TaxID=7038 RepID=UPI003B28954E